ncbi:hypothetical protein EVAR_70908_1 [Eumeta japonica]|uniref:Uncharacterized protein n=1 Tax=Eumeta variegata TaxID=151549 RepID=A0A4C2AAR5_EUMVA|nr:hypothetical protein EVAR_70908_1 [Eumeta japonica]
MVFSAPTRRVYGSRCHSFGVSHSYYRPVAPRMRNSVALRPRGIVHRHAAKVTLGRGRSPSAIYIGRDERVRQRPAFWPAVRTAVPLATLPTPDACAYAAQETRFPSQYRSVILGSANGSSIAINVTASFLFYSSTASYRIQVYCIVLSTLQSIFAFPRKPVDTDPSWKTKPSTDAECKQVNGVPRPSRAQFHHVCRPPRALYGGAAAAPACARGLTTPARRTWTHLALRPRPARRARRRTAQPRGSSMPIQPINKTFR